MKILASALTLFCGLLQVAAQEPASERVLVLIVVGASGEPEYASTFATAARQLQDAGAAAGAAVQTIGLEPDASESLALFTAALQREEKEGSAELWIVLLGHGAAGPGEPKFQLTGDDLSAPAYAALLQPFHRPLVLIDAFSASGAFLAPTAGANRVLITATKNGTEHQFAHFGEYFAQAIASPAADLDRDGQTSLLEAWLTAAGEVAAFYKNEGRIATEHSLLDDNGDGKGTPPDWFQGTRAIKKAKAGAPVDGLRASQIHLVPSPAERALSAAQRAERNLLETDFAALRAQKSALPEAAYFQQLEVLLLKLARIYEKPQP